MNLITAIVSIAAALASLPGWDVDGILRVWTFRPVTVTIRASEPVWHVRTKHAGILPEGLQLDNATILSWRETGLRQSSHCNNKQHPVEWEYTFVRRAEREMHVSIRDGVYRDCAYNKADGIVVYQELKREPMVKERTK